MDVDDYSKALKNEKARLINLTNENSLAVQREMLLSFTAFNQLDISDVSGNEINALNDDLFLQRLLLKNVTMRSYMGRCLEYIGEIKDKESAVFDGVKRGLNDFACKKNDLLRRAQHVVDCLESDLDYIISESESILLARIDELFCQGEMRDVNDMVVGGGLSSYDSKLFAWSRDIVSVNGSVYETVKIFEKEIFASKSILSESAGCILMEINAAMKVIFERFMNNVLCAVEGISDAISVELKKITWQAMEITGFYGSGFYEKRLGVKYPPLMVSTQKADKLLGGFYERLEHISDLDSFCRFWGVSEFNKRDSYESLNLLREVAIKESDKILKNLSLRLRNDIFTQVKNATDMFISSFVYVEGLIVDELECNKKNVMVRLMEYDDSISRLVGVNRRIDMAIEYINELEMDISNKVNK